ncbi:MAG: arsenic efflux protein [Bacteroidetes bacterium]|uniref:Arsenic efflux protein n=1 Tax=Candidatus Cryptobacteroides excrementipullorum TaxID=2840761 RepID=A0A9D9ITQ2_9BACT|nr:arsenic efflux protein [Candidatus Cryptobacteroides excrementipullorum]
MIADIIRNSILITGLVVIMMMMIESLNIESRGMIFSGLKRTRAGQVTVATLLGLVPGCIGGFAAVSLYTHRIISFGALVAMMIASCGDEAFMMLAMFPQKAMVIFVFLFALAMACGITVDMLRDKAFSRRHIDPETADGLPEDDIFELHEGHDHGTADGQTRERRHLGWRRAVMFLGVLLFIAALVTGKLGHYHPHGEHLHSELALNLLSEDWMYVLFGILSIVVLGVLCLASDHFVEEHLWNHIVRRHLPVIFGWTFGVLALLGAGMHYLDIESWISGNTALMILLAVAVGIIPESGPHMIFVTLYASGIVPLPVLLASCIAQDGHSSLPLLAESKSSFFKAKLVSCTVALAAGFGAMLLGY